MQYLLFCGEISGQVIKKNLKIKKINSKYINNSILVIFVFIISLMLNNYFYGNIYSYIKYTKNVKQYLKNNYEEFNILNSKYIVSFSSSKYEYLVKINDNIYKLYAYGNNIIKDEFKENEVNKLILEINSKEDEYLDIKIINKNDKVTCNISNKTDIVFEEYIKYVYDVFNNMLDENKINYDLLNISYKENDKIKFAIVEKDSFSNFEYYKLSFLDEIIK